MYYWHVFIASAETYKKSMEHDKDNTILSNHITHDIWSSSKHELKCAVKKAIKFLEKQ